MKKKYIHIILLLLISLNVRAQSDSTRNLDVNTDLFFYFLEDDFFLLPVIRIDNEELHFEARYNYEDMKTFSGWIGYNFSGGEKLEYEITPMIGGVAGTVNGIAPGLEATLSLGKFELYTEAEYVFDFESKDGNYFYEWTDLTFAPKDWIWFGLSGQRLRSYLSNLDFQRGVIFGAGEESWEVNGYLFNIDTDSPFYLAGITYSF